MYRFAAAQKERKKAKQAVLAAQQAASETQFSPVDNSQGVWVCCGIGCNKRPDVLHSLNRYVGENPQNSMYCYDCRVTVAAA